MTTVFPFIVSTSIIGAASYFVFCLVRATLARSRVVQAIIAWEEEAALSAGRGSERYATTLPMRQQLDDELSVTTVVLEQQQQLLDALLGAPFHVKLRRSWATDCKRIQARATKATADLQNAAFWAQFLPGSAYAEARFNSPINDPDD